MAVEFFSLTLVGLVLASFLASDFSTYQVYYFLGYLKKSSSSYSFPGLVAVLPACFSSWSLIWGFCLGEKVVDEDS